MKKIIFILTASALVMVIIILFMLFETRQVQRSPIIPTQPTPLPITESSPAPTIAVNPITAFDLVRVLPYSSPEFNIEYLTVSEVVIITIKEAPVETQKRAALDWIINQGFDPNALNIQYNIYPYLQ